MSKTLYIHIGVHKTGSTAIQSYFASHGLLLRCLGENLAYPRLGGRVRSRNQDIADDIASATGEFSSQARYLDYVSRTKFRKILFSAEQFYNFPVAPRFFEPFAGICQVRIVVFLRRQDAYIESMYRQMVRNASLSRAKGFSLYSRRWLKQTAPHRTLDWGVRLEPWERTFGRENIIAIPYSEGKAFDSVAVMGKVLSVKRTLRFPLWVRRNDSLCCETIELLRRLEEEKTAYDKKRVEHFNRLVPEPSFSYYSPEERRKVVEAYRDANLAAGARFQCDISPLLPESLAQDRVRKCFDPGAFDYEAMLRLARKASLVR